MATDNFRRLVRARGWSIDRYQRWLADTLCAELLPTIAEQRPDQPLTD